MLFRVLSWRQEEVEEFVGGLVVDLSPMKGILVDKTARTATEQLRVLSRELDRETKALGLATTGGTVSNT